MKITIMLSGFILATFWAPILATTPPKTPPSEKDKIESLIVAIQNLQYAQFCRNGTLYDAPTAAKHLRLKLSKAGDNIKTAQEFIEKIASKSSMSGEEYKIIYKDGRQMTTKQFFNDKLKTL